MGVTNIGKNTNGRLNDFFEVYHFAGFGNTGFENTQLMFWFDSPHRNGYAKLRVVTFWTTNNIIIGFEQLVQPFFYDGFTVTTRDANNRQLKLFAMPGAELLQSVHRIINSNEPRIGVLINVFGCFAHHEATYTGLVGHGYKLMSVAALANKGNEHRRIGMRNFAAVYTEV